MEEHNIVTSYNFNDHEFLIKMHVNSSLVEISITDKQSAEEWHCNYDNLYIENVTQKTGNFKQFKIFITMLKAGFLKTSNCISLELLTYEDLEALRIRRIKHSSTHFMNQHMKSNRRYLILIYNVEFDRILYPLPLEYCGPPDPSILQATIRKLEEELRKYKDELELVYNRGDFKRNKRVDELEAQNRLLKRQLSEKGNSLNGRAQDKIHMLEMNLSALESKVFEERRLHNRLVHRLKKENEKLLLDVRQLKQSENDLMKRLRSNATFRSPIRRNETVNQVRGNASVKTLYRNEWKPGGHYQSPARVNYQKEIVAAHISRSRHTSQEKVKSRASSKSSTKSERSVEYNNDLYRSKSGSKEQASRRQSSLDRSRASSLSSHHSLMSDARKTSSQNLKMKMQHSEEEFRVLENRINTLQKLLRNSSDA